MLNCKRLIKYNYFQDSARLRDKEYENENKISCAIFEDY